MDAIGGQTRGLGKGDHGDRGVTEFVEAIAHGDHMFLAGQSTQMSVEYQHDWSATLLADPTRLQVLIN